MATTLESTVDDLPEAPGGNLGSAAAKDLLFSLLDRREPADAPLPARQPPAEPRHPLLRRPISPFRPRPRSILYYPSCGFDWAPLLRPEFRGEPEGEPNIDTFVYCDFGVTRDSFLTHLIDEEQPLRRGGLWIESCAPIRPQLAASLACEEGAPIPLAAAWQPHPTVQWGWRVRLRREAMARSRIIELLYLGTEGTMAYWNLFARDHCAPEVLCVKRGGQTWSYWNGPLGELLRAGRRMPRYLVTTQPPDRMDSPWTEPWHEFAHWDAHNGMANYADGVWGYRWPDARLDAGEVGDLAA